MRLSELEQDSENAFLNCFSALHKTYKNFSLSLKPLEGRHLSADQVIARLRSKLAKVPGAPTYLQAVQGLRIGGRVSISLLCPA